jgi:uncharacterized membrane protein
MMERHADVCYPKPFSYLRFIGWATAIGAVLMPAFYINFTHTTDIQLKALNFAMLVVMPVIWLSIYGSLAQNYRRITPGFTPDTRHFVAWGLVQLALQLFAAWLVSIGLEAVL